MIIHGWTLNLDYCKRLKAALSKIPKGFQWKQFDLVMSNKMFIPTKPGVYMLCLRPPLCYEYFEPKGAPLFNAMYIGRTKNLKSRFDNYANPRATNRNINNSHKHSARMTDFLKNYSNQPIMFVYTICDIEHHEIRIIEDLLIRSFGPSVNDKYGMTYPPVGAKVGPEQLI